MGVLKVIKRVLLLLIILVICWMVVFAVDYFRLNAGEKPLFCIPMQISEDGTVEQSWGVGYKVHYRLDTPPNEEPQWKIVPYWEPFQVKQEEKKPADQVIPLGDNVEIVPQ